MEPEGADYYGEREREKLQAVANEGAGADLFDGKHLVFGSDAEAGVRESLRRRTGAGELAAES